MNRPNLTFTSTRPDGTRLYRCPSGTSVAERLIFHSEVSPGGCWLWTAGLNNHGYGLMQVRPREVKKLAHRVSYETFAGPIPAGLSLDHLCRTPRCINPDHLEPVTHAENIQRGHDARRQERAA